MTLTFTDNSAYFSVNSGTGVTDSYPKNSVALRRNDTSFTISNGGDAQRALFSFDYSDVSTPATADSDALEIALAAILFS